MVVRKSRDSFDRAGLNTWTFFYESAAQLLYMHVSDMEDYAIVSVWEGFITKREPCKSGTQKEGGKGLIQSGGYLLQISGRIQSTDPRLQLHLFLGKRKRRRGKDTAHPRTLLYA